MNYEIISLLQLHQTRGFGRNKIWSSIRHFGSAQKVIQSGLDQQTHLLFGKYPVIDWKRELERVEKSGVQLISYQCERYPKNLLYTPNFPLLLYVKGELPRQEELNIAIIGTRSATLYGREMGAKIAEEVGQGGGCVVSGLARGIDTAAHQGALRAGGKTVAVIGSGLSHIYPQENRALAEEIAQSGALISEFPMETPPSKGLFPKRNHTISGMSNGVCLIESPLKGGGMLTMQIAEKQKKELFTLPGRLDWPTFAGNHFLLKEKKASLVENGYDLLKHFQISKTQMVKQTKFPQLNEEERAFLERLPHEEKTIEELVLLTQFPMMKLNVLLTRLILKKVVKEFPGKIYKRI